MQLEPGTIAGDPTTIISLLVRVGVDCLLAMSICTRTVPVTFQPCL